MSLPEHTEAECHYLSIQRLNVINRLIQKKRNYMRLICFGLMALSVIPLTVLAEFDINVDRKINDKLH